ncbi:MAG: 16S rRNA (adenine(1518)-N(6)/adenine(1519)-N(6))-dimethyltransferase RsmA [Candidatus Nomurabacteria bacterium]
MFHQAKKSMGQNFLKSAEALRKMCEAGEVNDKDIIVEIGPGKGALTEKLLEKAKKVVAVEKDRDLIDILSQKFVEEIKNGKFLLLNDNILYFEPSKYDLKEGEYKIIANIPYNITGAIIKRFLSEVTKPSIMTLLVQKEVAERIVARDNKESILSLSVKAYGTPKYIMKVHKRFFSPAPKVDSAIISINNISNSYLKDKNKEDSFFRIIKTAFAHKRKVLRKNLEEIEKDSIRIDEMMEKLDINPKARAENIKFNKWIDINNYLNTK